MRLFIPISIKIIFVILSTIITVISITTYHFVQLYAGTSKAKLIETGNIVTHQINNNLIHDTRRYLDKNNSSIEKKEILVFNLKPSINSFITDSKDIIFIYLLDFEGETIAHSGENPIPQDLFVGKLIKPVIEGNKINEIGLIVYQNSSKNNQLSEIEKYLFNLFNMKPAIYNFYYLAKGQEEFLNSIIYVGVSNEKLIMDLSKNLRISFYILCIIILFSSLLVVILSRNITKPVKILSSAVRDLGIKGISLKSKVTIKSNDEIKLLSDNFNNAIDELLEKQRIQDSFDISVGREIADYMVDSKGTVPSNKVVSVLFGDIRGFTSISETMKPNEVVNILNILFEVISNTIEEDLGIVDKYIGDSVMAIYGLLSPKLEEETHKGYAQLACLTAMRINRKLSQINDNLTKQKLPKIQFGMGVNTGNVSAGMIGGGNRLNYTIIGDTVNVAARLCDLSGKELDAPLIITEETYQYCKDIIIQFEEGEVKIKGKKDKLKVYSVFKIIKEKEYLDYIFGQLSPGKIRKAVYDLTWLNSDKKIEIICRFFDRNDIFLNSIISFHADKRIIHLNFKTEPKVDKLIKIIFKNELQFQELIGVILNYSKTFNKYEKETNYLVQVEIKKIIKPTLDLLVSKTS